MSELPTAGGSAILAPHPLVLIHVDDALRALKAMPDKSVHMVMTSPPFYGLRDYKIKGQIGLEATLDEHINKLVAVFMELRRVLRDDGTLWVEMGDGFVGTGKWLNRKNTRLDVGNLVGLPWMVAFAIRDAGWMLRAANVWARENPLPEAVTDRPCRSHSDVFLFTKSTDYFYDRFAVMEPVSAKTNSRGKGVHTKSLTAGEGVRSNASFKSATKGRVSERNLRTVWRINTDGTHGEHEATFPVALTRSPILAGTSAHGCCRACGAQWKRDVQKLKNGEHVEYVMRGWLQGCACPLTGTEADRMPCTVLDPFGGEGTTGIGAAQMGRMAVLIELNPATAKKAAKRVAREGNGQPPARTPKIDEQMAEKQTSLFGAEA